MRKGWSKNKAKKVIKIMCYFWGNTVIPYLIGNGIRHLTNDFGFLINDSFNKFMFALMGYLTGLVVVWTIYLIVFISIWIIEWANDENEGF